MAASEIGKRLSALEERDRAEQQLTDALLEQLDAYRLGIGAAEAQSGAGAGEAVENGARGARAARGGNDRCWNNTDAGGVPSAHHANNDTENVACVTEEEFAELLQNVASEKKGGARVALLEHALASIYITCEHFAMALSLLRMPAEKIRVAEAPWITYGGGGRSNGYD
eukprot:gene6637-23146_t